MRRRSCLGAAVAGLLPPALSAPAIAQARWPNKPVKVVVPFAAGGATDVVARAWSERMSVACGQQFVIENRGGA